MKLKGQTVLITGGGSGIGLELARQLARANNVVIICGRSAEKLEAARSIIPQLHTFQCDIASADARQKLWVYIRDNHPKCSILVNNAAIVHKTNFAMDPDMEKKVIYETQVNFIAPVTLIKSFLTFFPGGSGVINITTGLVYAPRAIYPVYNATKVALHSFTEVLREQLKGRPVRIIEVMMPVVDTPWHSGEAPSIAISPERAVAEMISGIEKGRLTVRVGKVKLLAILARLAPKVAFRMINRIKN